MAWFKFGSKKVADEPTPVTAQRLEESLARQNLGVSKLQGELPVYYCFFNGIPVMFILASDAFAVVSAEMRPRLPVDREDDVLGWTTAFNAGNHLITALKKRDADGIHIKAEGGIFIKAGLTDAQLDKQLDLMLKGVLPTIDRFCTEFGLTAG